MLLRSGRFPSQSGEALISPKLARAFHLGVGDQLVLKRPAWTERIVGIGVAATNWTDGLLAVRGNELSGNLGSTFEPVQSLTLVDLPGHPSADELDQYPSSYISASSFNANNTPQRAVNWTLVSGAIALAIVGVVISGAFAVGARRQLVTLGQLSANGADEPQLRRLLSLQGVWSGVLGTALGLAGAVTTLELLHARLNGWIHRDIGPYGWSARDFAAIAVTGIVAATIAAFIPARTAARVPVLQRARRPPAPRRAPRIIVPIGVALFAGGTLVLTLVATASRNGSGGGDALALAAVLGGLLALSGACCVSPVIVASLAHFGRFVRGGGRVAVRSVVRSRASSAAVVMALVAINAGAIAISTAFSSTTRESRSAAAFMPDDTLIVTRSVPSETRRVGTYLPVPHSVEQTLRTILPKATWNDERAVLDSLRTDDTAATAHEGGIAIRGRKIVANGGGDTMAILDTGTMVVADPAVLHMVGLSSADAATLQREGVIALTAPSDAGGHDQSPVRVQIGSGVNARTVTAARTKHSVRATGAIGFLITPAKAQELGASIVTAGRDRHQSDTLRRVTTCIDRCAAPVVHVRTDRTVGPNRAGHRRVLVGAPLDRDLRVDRPSDPARHRRAHRAHRARDVAVAVGRGNAATSETCSSRSERARERCGRSPHGRRGCSRSRARRSRCRPGSSRSRSSTPRPCDPARRRDSCSPG